tara:strand:- start:581 stop:1009 length:429 start_codon:yes stop_codon:yes gene_type:complete
MAITVIEQVLANTDRRLVIKRGVTIGGTENEATATVLDVSAAAFKNVRGQTMTGVAIERIILNTVSVASDNLTVTLLWDADTDVRIITSNEAGAGALDIDVGSEWGGLTKDGTNPTGDIFVTTANGTAGEGYDLILVMKKVF